MLDICLLGCGGMMPLSHRALTALMVRCCGSTVLIDCGEGTQVSVRETGWGFKNIDHILLTHYHGDHVSGLPGLLLTIGNAERTETLHIYGPKGLNRIVSGLLLIAPELPFPIELHEISGNFEERFTVGPLQMRAFRADHGMPCLGYRLDLLRQPEFLPEKAKQNQVPLKLWSQLQKGNTVEMDGITYTPDMVLGSSRKGLSLCYCTDTRPLPALVQAAEGTDLFVCEGMYGEEEKKSRANEYKHMTFREAAMAAAAAQTKELWLTHYSPSLVRPKEILKEATDIFANTCPGKDRLMKVLTYEEECKDSCN